MSFLSRLGFWLLVFNNKLRYYWYVMLRKLRRRQKSVARSRRSMGLVTQNKRNLLKFKIIRFLAIGGAIGVVLAILLFFGLFAWFSKDLPAPGEVVRRSGFSTKILDRNGELLFDLYDQERRTPATLAELPEDLKNATIAVEDKDFYKHGGFDAMTILRIPYNFVARQRLIGGSTLTQQLVKNVLLTNERTITRKFKELVLSLQLERTFSKDQILEMYLNEAPYGGTAWGVGTAAEVYFDKPVSELNLVQSAILAGLPQRPSAYSPFSGQVDDDGEPLWKVRAKGVLRRMREDNHITELAYDQALSDLDTVEFSKKQLLIKAPHFVFYVRNLLDDLYGEEVVTNSGFKVTTSLDLKLQEQAEEIVLDEVSQVEGLNITNGAVLVMDPRSGEILSMVGSKDFASEDIDGQFNVVVDGLRQPGSSIKPVTYLTLLQRGYTPASVLDDTPTKFVSNEGADAYEPGNYDGKFHGPVSVRDSLASSLNIPAVKALALVGIDSFLQQAYDMGFVTLQPTAENKQRFGLAVTLGGAEVHLIDTVTAYSSFATGGIKTEPVAILKIEDKNGKTIFEHKPVEGRRLFSEAEAFLINHILSDNAARAIAFGTRSLLNISPNIAVKTGTTNDQRDNWAIGWSREIIVGAWVGNNDNSQMKTVASGVSGATPIWRRIVLAALDSGYSDPAWEIPESVEKVMVDSISGYPEHDGYASKSEYALANTLPALPDLIHTKLKLCKGENKLAPEARMASGDYEEKEFIVLKESDPLSLDGINRWQEGINSWIAAQEDGRYKVPTEYCGDQSEIYIDLKKPENEKTYSDENIEVEIQSDSGDGIEKIELLVNGSVRETINDRSYTGKIKLSSGRYEIWAKAYTRSGKTKESDKKKIGTGGVDWKTPDPTPTPSPSPSPSASPSPSPTLIPTPTSSPLPT
ncbi:MAG: hypothetical protein COY80_00510 [Candidatus Pacebacteria bacterium CG_4_10_14_0_8_um_filter_42_14]|nr:MAG: hypothetical protein COY80_00510 [Candidatus Pacebacteria bacterium CG_4_10_14_0_8_um_filter_42_14]